MNAPAPLTTRERLAHFLALNRTVGIVLLTVLCFGLGEELWSQFMPEYLRIKSESPGAANALSWAALSMVGLYACLRNLFEGFCYIGGGQLTAWLGDRGSLILFAVMTIAGYVLFLSVQAPMAAVIAALLIMGWEPLSVPVTFTTVGSTVDQSRRGMAFAIQSIQKRLPRIIGPAVAGFVLGAAQRVYGDVDVGRAAGMHWLVAAALVLGLVSLAVQLRWMPHREPPLPGPNGWELIKQMPMPLRRLWLAEIFTRWCDWLNREFVVLYLLVVRQVAPETAGLLFAVQNVTALCTYIPVGRWTKTVGLQPFIGVTFIFFALFPLTLAVTPNELLLFPFIVNGLREIGEPARKALITSSLPEAWRARGVGLYWGTRSFAFFLAPLVGAALWYAWGPESLLYAAFGMGCIGAAIFYIVFPKLEKSPTS
jgi:MFS family permease